MLAMQTLVIHFESITMMCVQQDYGVFECIGFMSGRNSCMYNANMPHTCMKHCKLSVVCDLSSCTADRVMTGSDYKL